jgi:4-hydroxy-tetrahydrodipicolinate reductase
MSRTRILFLGLGPIGRACAAQVLSAEGVEPVAAVDAKPALAGRDLGELAGHGALGIAVRDDLDRALDDLSPDLVVHATGSFLDDVTSQLLSIVRRGIHVVSTCEELAFPVPAHAAHAAELDRAARQARAVLLGTGINPGFVMDKLVVTLLSACTAVEHVEVTRIVDAGTRREPFQRKICAGTSVAEFERARATGRAGHIGLAQSAHMIAASLGLEQAEVRETLDPVVAESPVATAYLRVEPGQVAGIRQAATLSAAGRERIRMELEMYVGAERPRDAIAIDGSPPLTLEVSSGVAGDQGTAAVVASAVPLVPGLAPGLRTMLDVPLRPPLPARR